MWVASSTIPGVVAMVVIEKFVVGQEVPFARMLVKRLPGSKGVMQFLTSGVGHKVYEELLP